MVINEKIDETLRNLCLEIEDRYQLKLMGIGAVHDHAHLLVQSVSTYMVYKLVKVIRSITAHEIFRLCPHVKKQLWDDEFWSDGYFASSLSRHSDENTVKGQGWEYQIIHKDRLVALF